MPEKHPRSRNASGSADKPTASLAGTVVATTSSSELDTCFRRILEAERQLAAPPAPPSFLVKPSLLDSGEHIAGSIATWTRDLSFDDESIAQLGIRLELPREGEVRARKLISRSRRVMTGKYPSWKIGRLVHWESRLESKAFRLLDICPGVVTFAEQPLTIHYLKDGHWFCHVPDVAFFTTEGTLWILEIKSKLDRSLVEAVEREAMIAPRLKCLGMNYAVVREADILAGRSVATASLLMRFGRSPGSANSDRSLLQLVDERASVNRTELIGQAYDGRHAIHTAASLVIRGEISLNWHEADLLPMKFQKLRGNNAEESLSWLRRALGVIK